MQVTKFAIPEVIFGANALEYVVPCAVRNGARKVLLVSDPGLEAAGWVERVIDILDESGLNWVYYNAVNSNPRDFQVAQGAEFYLRQRADVVIALGGGSPMDLAKGIALVASNGGRISDYEGANKIQKPLPPMIFIPTTAGSGADISQFAIITDVQRQVKMAIVSRTLVPNISIIDPNFLQTKPEWLIMASAIDAMAHAIEAYVSVLSSPFTEMHSLKAIELIMRHLEEAVRTKSMESLTMLSTASTAAGMAFSNASLGADHAIAHSLGGKYDVMHGLVHPVLLPAVMRFNLPACPEKMALIGEIVTGRRAGSRDDTALMGIQALEDFFQSLNIPTRLSRLIPDSNSLKEVSELAVQDACCLTNPRSLTTEDCLAMCEEVW
jgi:alcohol dehydrogenase